MAGILRNIRTFLNTEIERTGAFSAIGNYLLSPVRYFFHGTTIAARGKDIVTKQNTISQIKATIIYAHPLFVEPLMSLALLPGLVLGMLFKGFAFLNQEARNAHHFVTEKLTPQNVILGTTDKPLGEVTLESQLKNQLNSAQKIECLVINVASTVNRDCSILISKLKPSSVILVGNNTDELKKVNSHYYFPQTKWRFWKEDQKPETLWEAITAPNVSYLGRRLGLFTHKHNVFIVTPEASASFLSPSV